MPTPSQRAVDLIVAFEVTSENVYVRKYRRPIWPAVESGITIGIGYDIGYVTRAEFQAVWAPHLPAAMVNALLPAVGKKGAAAAAILPTVRDMVDVPWAAANDVFRDNTLPKFQRETTTALPNCDLLSSDSFGALVSLTFNRGASYAKSRKPNDAKDRYREMRAIKRHMTNQNFAAIPAEILSMQRIWPEVAGLQRRRREEAAMFADGL